MCINDTVGTETKDPAYEWSIHINLLSCAQYARESSIRVRTLLGILTDRKKHVEKSLGWHRAQEVAAGFLGKTIVGRISVMCLRGVAVVPRCLVRYGSTSRNERVWGWASLDQEKTRVLVEIQGTMGDLTLKLHAQPPSINLVHNDDETTNEQCSFVVIQTGNLSCTHPITLAYPCKHYLSTLQTNYKPSKSAGTRLENIPHVVDLAAFPAPYLYPLNADLTNDQRVRQTASMPKPFPLRTIAFSTPKSSVNSVLRAGRRTRSPEGLENEPYELKSDDMAEMTTSLSSTTKSPRAPNSINISNINTNTNTLNTAPKTNRLPHPPPPVPLVPPNLTAILLAQGLVGMGGIGNKSGELQKSREAGAELHNLTGDE
ncbi:hypothetical protein PILCRDRAFT_7134 [Piloderma croceum F 1598]|uniref:Uncharacterized protein n=1 Tax=Piloderma croceum (strain F 1598) TaxID=765440 RepID=A0A0C3FW39_PILCF|nr:hypothetical protein PILCRDRAFT_7134 [Piloderma croceum F 1598]